VVRLTNGGRALHDRRDSSGNAGGDGRNTGSNGRNTWCSDLGNGSDDGSEEGE
jgi:hypothetical protein